jgi:hypothetical protein
MKGAASMRCSTESASVPSSRRGQDGAGRGVAHVPEGVDGGQGRDHKPTREDDGGAPEAAPHRPLAPQDLADGGACPDADAALLEITAPSGGGGLIAHPCVGASRGVAGGEVEDHGGGDYGHAGHPDVVADALLLEKAHDAACGPEAEGAAAGQQESVGLPDPSHGV